MPIDDHKIDRIVYYIADLVVTRVPLTGGNRSSLTGYRSNRSGPVPVWAGTKPGQIQIWIQKNEKFPKNS